MSQRLERIVRSAQAGGRIPAVSVAVHRADRPLWTFQVGASGTARPLDPDTLFRIGSITKTFTAVLVLRCRDAGLLDLDDQLQDHLPVPEPAALPIRRLLSHTSGLQREPFGDPWDNLRMPDRERLLAEVAHAERVLGPARRFHYSNLAFALLGELVATKLKLPWPEAVRDLTARLGLSSVTVDPADHAAQGYLVEAYSDHARPEPPVDFRAFGPAAQLWATAADLARWSAFLADPESVDPDGRVLAATTLDEMRWPLTTTDQSQWAAGFGLGLLVIPSGDRATHVGHDGAMPGFLASAYGRRGGTGTPPGFGAAALGSAGTGEEVFDLPHDLLAAAMADDPPDIAPWTPGEPAPERYRSILGPWWGEGFEFVFTWRGRLEARARRAPAGLPPAVFAPTEDPEVLRGVSGREAGELLRLTRDGTGRVVLMRWAGYRFTRDQQAFAAGDYWTSQLSAGADTMEGPFGEPSRAIRVGPIERAGGEGPTRADV